MTNIATKNRSLIVKGGSIALDCNCCSPTNPCCSGDLPSQLHITYDMVDLRYTGPGYNTRTLTRSVDLTLTQIPLINFVGDNNGVAPVFGLRSWGYTDDKYIATVSINVWWPNIPENSGAPCRFLADLVVQDPTLLTDGYIRPSARVYAITSDPYFSGGSNRSPVDIASYGHPMAAPCMQGVVGQMYTTSDLSGISRSGSMTIVAVDT